MANTTFKGPVTSLNGFIGGPNKNAGDTQQGGKNTYSFASTSTVTDGTNTLDATENEGVLIYVDNGAAGAASICFFRWNKLEKSRHRRKHSKFIIFIKPDR